MTARNLPKEMRGMWIWGSAATLAPEEYYFFRHEFMLDEIPRSAELWLTARSFYHVYINGYHLSYALNSCPVRGAYIGNFDIAYLLGTGVNNISILAHNTNVSRSSCQRQPGGLWCQIDIDDKPAVWSDSTWRMLSGTCFSSNRSRRSQAGGFTEKVDFRQFPRDWHRRQVNLEHWRSPATCIAVDEEPWQLLDSGAPEFTAHAVPVVSVENQGIFRKDMAGTSVAFDKLLRSAHHDGVYAAESYFYVPDITEVGFELFCDNPYRLFINGRCIKEQAVVSLPPGAVYEVGRSLCFRQGELVEPEGRMLLQKGWNQLLFCEEMKMGAAGMTLLFPDHHPEGLRIQRAPEKESMPGWNVAGPLRTPLANVTGNFSLKLASDREFFIPVEEYPVDEGAELMGCEFIVRDKSRHSWSEDEVLRLQQGEFAVLAVPQCVFGCPQITVIGSEGDLLDMTTGTELVDGQVLPWDGGRENCDTAVLPGGEVEWMTCAPRGVKYIMLTARLARSQIEIRQPVIKVRQYNFANAGSFTCSDDTLVQLWQTSKRTLQAVTQEVFIDSPCREETQYIADAAITSWAAYHTFGDFRLPAKSIAEFAAAQFETGEMPAACPSDVYFNIPDYALLWPVWLQRHFLYTGDRVLLQKMMPHLEKLFSYFEAISVSGKDILGDLGAKYAGYCFLDHGPIDRRGVVTGLNALYCRALLSGAMLFEEEGNGKAADAARKTASRVARQIQELTWNEERQLFADGWSNGEKSDQYSLQTNILAIYGAIARNQNCKAMFDQLISPEPPYFTTWATSDMNPYFMYFVLETAFALGRRQWALELIRWYWKGMLDRGAATWWELFDPAMPMQEMPNGSSCHSYGASLNGFLITEIAGIRPARPGFTTAYFNPLTHGISSVSARIPTTYGHITLDWKLKPNGTLEAVIDANYPLAVIPELEPSIAESATIHVSDEVTIFASE